MLPLSVGALGVEHHLAYLFNRRIIWFIWLIFLLIFDIRNELRRYRCLEQGRFTLGRSCSGTLDQREVSALLEDLGVDEVVEQQLPKIAF